MFTSILLVVAAAAPVHATLDRMIAVDGPAYLAARDELLTHGRDALPVVDARLAAAQGAERASLAAARAWLVAPEACARAYAVQGLDPAVYGRARKAIPLATRELARLPDEAKPVLVELWTKTRAAYPYAPPSAYPRGSDVASLRAAERAALDVGILFALSSSGLAEAPTLLAAALVDEKDPDVRRAAAQGLGRTHDPRAVAPLARAARTDADASIRHAAITALGVHRSRASLDVLATIVVDGDDAARATAAGALAVLGSSWANGDPALRDGAIRALQAAPKTRATTEALARLRR